MQYGILTNYSEWKTIDLIHEINRYDKKLDKIKTQGALWIIGIAIKSIRAELDKRIKDPQEVSDLIFLDKDI